MLKRIAALLSALIILFSSYSVMALPQTAEDAPAAPIITAEFALLMDADSGQALYARKADERAYPASITKMMTLLLAVEKAESLTALVTVSQKALDVPSDSSKAYLEKGDVLTLEDCLYAMMLPSGNDAANVVGEFIGGSLENFINMMNTRAQELGMTGTHFMNTNGYHDSNHYTTCEDFAKLTRACLKNAEYMKVVGAKSHTARIVDGPRPRNMTYDNTNALLTTQAYSGATGMKTGTSSLAGATLVATASKKGMNLICVILKDAVSERFRDARVLLDWGFNNFQTFDINELIATEYKFSVHVSNASEDDEANGELQLHLKGLTPRLYTTTKTAKRMLTNEASSDLVKEYPTNILAPIKMGDELGTVTIRYKDEILYRGTVLASRDIQKRAETPQDLIPIPDIGRKTFFQKLFGSWVFWSVFFGSLFIMVAAFTIIRYRQNQYRRRLNRITYRYRR